MAHKKMTKKQLLAWRRGFEAVAEIRLAELRATTPAEKCEQLARLFAFARWLPNRRKKGTREILTIHNRWQHLRNFYLNERQKKQKH